VVVIPRMTIKSTLNFTKKGGYTTCPFDLLFFTFKGACYNIKNDFSGFFDIDSSKQSMSDVFNGIK